MSKPTYWVSMKKWMGLTVEEHRRLDAYCRDMGMELGIDLIGDRAFEMPLQEEFQRDHDDHMDEMSQGGKPYKDRR